MIHFLNGIERASALAERELAEDDAKHRVLSEPKHPIFRTEPVKRLDSFGNEQAEGRIRANANFARVKAGSPRPELRHNFKDPGEPIK